MDHQKNQPSVKPQQAPGNIFIANSILGGQSSFSFGWGDDSQQQQPKRAQQQQSKSPFATDEPVQQQRSQQQPSKSPFATDEPVQQVQQAKYVSLGHLHPHFRSLKAPSPQMRKRRIKIQQLRSFKPLVEKAVSPLEMILVASRPLVSLPTSNKTILNNSSQFNNSNNQLNKRLVQ